MQLFGIKEDVQIKVYVFGDFFSILVMWLKVNVRPTA